MFSIKPKFISGVKRQLIPFIFCFSTITSSFANISVLAVKHIENKNPSSGTVNSTISKKITGEEKSSTSDVSTNQKNTNEPKENAKFEGGDETTHGPRKIDKVEEKHNSTSKSEAHSDSKIPISKTKLDNNHTEKQNVHGNKDSLDQKTANEAEIAVSVSVLPVTEQNDILKVHFIDVGQGDCTLIQLGKFSMLIDGGECQYSSKIIKHLRDSNIHELDKLVITHPHSDHIGGLIDVVDAFQINQVLVPPNKYKSDEFFELLNKIYKKRLKFISRL